MESDRVVIHGGTLSGIEADMSTMPDMAPTLAISVLITIGN